MLRFSAQKSFQYAIQDAIKKGDRNYVLLILSPGKRKNG